MLYGLTPLSELSIYRAIRTYFPSWLSITLGCLVAVVEFGGKDIHGIPSLKRTYREFPRCWPRNNGGNQL